MIYRTQAYIHTYDRTTAEIWVTVLRSRPSGHGPGHGAVIAAPNERAQRAGFDDDGSGVDPSRRRSESASMRVGGPRPGPAGPDTGPGCGHRHGAPNTGRDRCAGHGRHGPGRGHRNVGGEIPGVGVDTFGLGAWGCKCVCGCVCVRMCVCVCAYVCVCEEGMTRAGPGGGEGGGG